MMITPPTSTAALLLPFLAACTSVGPDTIPRDRFDYGEAISDSWKEQLLMSIVKLRYLDLPMFVDVSSVINQYSVEGNINLGAAWTSDTKTLWSTGATGRFTDRPTITYSPVSGKEFTRSLLTPVPPGALLFLIQAGWPVDLLYRTCVQTTNGVHNRGGASLMRREAPDPEFDEMIGHLTHIQSSGSIGLRVEGIDRGQSALMVIRRHEDADVATASQRLREILRLSQETSSFRVTYGADADDDQNIALLTRSVFEILIELSQQIDVPPEDIDEERTRPGIPPAAEPSRLIRVHSGEQPPSNRDAYVKVRYRDTWFWVDDRDIFSKRSFLFVQVLLNLTKDDSSGAVPLLTVGS